jgi:hypothetical protein
MAKFLVWILVVLAVLFALRLLNVGKEKRRRAADAAAGEARPPQEAMVRCVRCGVFVPRAEARPGPDGPTCGDPKCSQHP